MVMPVRGVQCLRLARKELASRHNMRGKNAVYSFDAITYLWLG